MFKPGDVVCLKSDKNTKMTVRSIIDTNIKNRTLEQEPYILGGACDGDVLCDFVYQNKLQRSYYKPIQLELIDW